MAGRITAARGMRLAACLLAAAPLAVAPSVARAKPLAASAAEAAAAAQAAASRLTTLPSVVLDSFQEAPAGPGWQGWGRPLGPAARAIDLAVITARKNHLGRLRYRDARGVVMLPLPELALIGRPTWLTLKVLGDGRGASLAVTVIDANNEWLTTAGVPVTWRGWQNVRLDLTHFVAHSRGDDDGEPDPPLALLSLNVEFPLPATGELLLDDLQVQQEPLQPFDYLDASLMNLAPSRIARPEDTPPQLVLHNRSGSTLSVQVVGRFGGRAIDSTVAVEPHLTGKLPLRAADSGPVPLDLTFTLNTGLAELASPRLSAGKPKVPAKRQFHAELAVLPPSGGAENTYFGLGEYTLDDLLDGRLERDLPDLRALGAGWIRLRLEPAVVDHEVTETDWNQIAQTLTLTQAHHLRVVGEVPLDAFVGAAGPPLAAREAIARLAPQIGAWLLAEPTASVADPAAAVAAARAAVQTRLLSPLLPTPEGCTAWVAPSALRPPPDGPFPRACRSLADLGLGTADQPGWFWNDLSAGVLTGSTDPAADLAIAMVCARSLPAVGALGRGRLRDDDSGEGLLPARGAWRPAVLAWAVAARFLAGVEPQTIVQPAAGVFEARFAGVRTVRVVWSEGGHGAVAPRPDEVVYDHLGRQRPTAPIEAGPLPVYLVGPVVQAPPPVPPTAG